MHENREISSTPWSDDQGRSAKATSRTADVYVPEKSDCVVLPVNQPNKGGQPFAEAGEGRAQTRENIAQSHMHPTQSGKRMSRGWTVCGRRRRKSRTVAPSPPSMTVELLRDSFFALQRKASPGIDGVTSAEYEPDWRIDSSICTAGCTVERTGQNLRDSLYSEGRRAATSRSASRRWRDRIIQQAVMTILNQIYEVDFKGSLIGSVPGRPASGA